MFIPPGQALKGWPYAGEPNFADSLLMNIGPTLNSILSDIMIPKNGSQYPSSLGQCDSIVTVTLS